MLESTTSTLISAIALAASLCATWITLRNKAHDDRRQIRASVHALLSQVFDLRSKNESEKLELRRTGDYQAYNTRTNANLEHLTAIAQLAREMIEQHRVPLSASSYAIVANALAMSNDPTAGTYWKKAVETASAGHQASSAMQNYGTYLYETGRHGEAKQMFDAAAAALARSGADPFGLGRHHHVHAMTQQQAGLASDAEISYATAAELYASIRNEQRRVFAQESLIQSRLAQTLPTQLQTPEAALMGSARRSA
jgi:tetratricopeptide (TPR) repeat protein